MIQIVVRRTEQAVVREVGYVLVEVGKRGLPGIQGEPGSFATSWRHAWDADTEYQPGDVVSYQGSSYTAVEPVDGDPPTSHLGEWELVVERGEDGDSAFQVWLDAGNSGTEQDFLDSLKGESGASAYEVAVSEGFSGSEAEWLESLVGEDGEDGAAATISVGTVTTGDPGSEAEVENVGTESAAIFDITIPRGDPGSDGSDGEEVELRTDSGFIQWRLGTGDWQNLIALSELAGADGREVELGASDTHIRWRYVGGDWTDLVALADLKGDKGDTGDSAYQLAVQEGFSGTLEEWLESLEGEPGREVELQTSETHIQWRYVGESTWTDLIALSELEGPAGADGRTILSGSGAPTTEGEDGDFYLDTTAWAIYGPKSGTWGSGTSLVGPPGVGVPSGGSTGQLLAKASGDDFDGEWVDPPSGGASTAAEVSYDNETSELEAEDVQAAIDELVAWINGLSWTAPNYPTAELPENPPPGELAFDTDSDRLQVGQGDGWEPVAYLSDVTGGSGDVTGPASATPGNLAVFGDASGKVLADGGPVPTGGDADPLQVALIAQVFG